MDKEMKAQFYNIQKGFTGQIMWDSLREEGEPEEDDEEWEDEEEEGEEEFEDKEKDQGDGEIEEQPTQDEVEGDSDNKEAKSGEDEDENEKDEDEEEEDDTQNSAIEIYFQAKYQDMEECAKVRCMIEILQSVLYEKMFDQLRTKEQLGYNVSVDYKSTCGIYGMAFVVQSADYSPIYLQKKVLDYIDTFYNEVYTEEMFNEYKKGVLDCKKQGSSDLDDEAQKLCNRMTDFSRAEFAKIEWNQNEKEIEYMENHCTYEEVRKFYKTLLRPSKQSRPSFGPEEYDLYKKAISANKNT